MGKYQSKKNLNMEEIWSFPIFLKIAIIENIRNLCDKIYDSQMQKYKVEDIVERLVEQKDKNDLRFKKVKRKYLSNDMEIKTAFIEHMTYKLKKMGKEGIPFLKVLDNQIEKLGLSSYDVVKKEHHDLALRKVSIGNSITSIKTISTINFTEVFEKTNGVEEMLNKDPIGQYSKMDFKTKNEYRNKIKELAKNSMMSEIYIAAKALECAKAFEKIDDKKSHIGYYLIGDGLNDLKEKIEYKIGLKEKIIESIKKDKSTIYIESIFTFTLFFTLCLEWLAFRLTKNIYLTFFIGIVGIIPISEIIVELIKYIVSKLIKPKIIPKLDLIDGIPEESKTFVIVPTIIKEGKKVEEIFDELESYYLGNKSSNLYFALLGDCSEEASKEMAFDKEVIEAGIKAVNRLNNKYKSNFPIFHFLYRERVYSKTQESFLGWERKRGLITEFNRYLLKREKGSFCENTLEKENNLPKIKYVITLDADTEICFDSALLAVGAMSHILNKPKLSEDKKRVEKGYAIMQPKVALNIESSMKSLFTKLFAGDAGIDSYSTACSDIYQDIFEEGIFTGKGIYDLEVFYEVLEKQIPENLVLSHDLLEGSYLRCALLSDVIFMDGYPSNYSSYVKRQSRWIRGDWQILRWLKSNLNVVSKFKIFDNLRRSLIELNTFILFIISLFINKNTLSYVLFGIAFLVCFRQTILNVINSVVFKKSYLEKQKRFTPVIDGIKGDFLRNSINLSFLPYTAFYSLNSIIKTLYRLVISKKKLLEWQTASDCEKTSVNTAFFYYKSMWINIVAFIICFLSFKASGIIWGIIFLLGPFVAFYISKSLKYEKVISKNEKEVLQDLAKRTSGYFLDFINEENNYLIPDNYQEDRKDILARRTSTTNIGLSLIAIASCYDLQIIDKNEAVEKIYKILEKVEILEKYNGQLYNWYNIKTLKPIYPRYISTVDNGNLIGYLYTVKEFLLENIEVLNAKESIEIIDKIIDETDFSFLYNSKNNLFSIGFDVESGKLTNSYYDLLASEARQASFIAIASKQVPQKHWNTLSRSLTRNFGYKGLVSWSGTAFEYLMPTINIPSYRTSLLDESIRFMILSQKKYASKLGIPWGISEAAFAMQDLHLNYQYKAFGVPWLGLKRGLGYDAVVAPYASILALDFSYKDVLENIKTLKSEGAYGKYGLFESIDYTPSRMNNNEKKEVVKCYMAHHQGLILISLNNFLNDNIMQKRFMRNPKMKSAKLLLEERMPKDMIITKEKKEKIDTLKYFDNGEYQQREYKKISKNIPISNVIANENYTIYMNQFGQGFSKWNDYYISDYSTVNELASLQKFFYIKNVSNNSFWTNTLLPNIREPSKYYINFGPDRNKYMRTDGDIDTITRITVSPEDNVEIRTIELKNNSQNDDVYLEVYSYFEPILSKLDEKVSHPAFNNMFLRYEYIDSVKGILIKRKNRNDFSEKYMLVMFYPEQDGVGDLEYSIDKLKFIGRDRNTLNPIVLENDVSLSKPIFMTTLEPAIVMKRTIKIEKSSEFNLFYICCVGNSKEEVLELGEKYFSKEIVLKTFNLSRAKSLIESRFYNLKSTQINVFQKIAGYIVEKNDLKTLNLLKTNKKILNKENLWKFGISGDNPIITMKIKYVNDIDTLKEIIKCYEYLRSKRINFDLVLLNEEKNSYEKYTKDAILSSIFSSGLGYLINQNAGIFILDNCNISSEEIETILQASSLIFDAHKGTIEKQLFEYEEEMKENVVKYNYKKAKENEINESTIQLPEVSFFNGYGGFIKNQYVIKIDKTKKTPMPWSNILSNGQFGSVITAARWWLYVE